MNSKYEPEEHGSFGTKQNLAKSQASTKAAIGMLIAAAIFLAIGIVLLCIGNNGADTSNWVETTGIVVGYNEDRDGSDMMYAPIYQYTVDGVKFTFESSIYSNIRDTNDTVIFYNPDNHGEAVAKREENSQNIIAIAFVAIGGLIVALSIFQIIRNTILKRKKVDIYGFEKSEDKDETTDK